MNQSVQLNIKVLCDQAGISPAALADKLDLPVAIISGLEEGKGNPRVDTVLQLALELGILLNRAPREVLRDLIPEAAFNAVSDVYNLSRMFLHEPDEVGYFTEASEAWGAAETSLARTQRLLARTRYTKDELAEITGLSMRYLTGRFELASSVTSSLGLTDFLRLAAALAPAHGANIVETFYYLLGDDLYDVDTLELLRMY